MQELTFTTRLDAQGKPEDYSVEGMLTQDGETFPVGLFTTSFNRAFDELIYWLHAIESDSSNAAVNVSFKTI